MVAVGAMAMSSELRSPWVAMRSRRSSQRASSVTPTPHRSICSFPAATRVSAKFGCAPNCLARSTDVDSAQ